MILDVDGRLMDTEVHQHIASWERTRWGLTLDGETFFVPHGGDVTEHRYEVLAGRSWWLYDRPMSHRGAWKIGTSSRSSAGSRRAFHLSLVWAVRDRASTGWRGFRMTADGLWLLHDLRPWRTWKTHEEKLQIMTVRT